jgi:hypothetical protein
MKGFGKLSRKRLIIIGSVAVALGIAAFMGGIGWGDGFTNPVVEEPRVADGESLYQGIMTVYPDLVLQDFHVATNDPDGAEPNVMQLPRVEWDSIDRDQQISLAQYLNSMGGEWQIQVGEVSSDGTKILSGQSVITSTEWRQTLK